MNINAYLSKVYGPQPCWELVADVLATEGIGVNVEYRTVNRSIREMANAFRIAVHRSAHGYQQTQTPGDFSIVLMGRNAVVGVHHCGIWYDGKVLHAEPRMSFYEEISSLSARYHHIEFWSKA